MPPGHRNTKPKKYYFCSVNCKKKFDADTLNYTTEKIKEEPLKEAPKTAEYTCPMHPEVVSDSPGNCPKCGMALEPKTV